MLTAATLGMFAYGLYSVGWVVADIVRGARLELWAEAGQVLFGLLMMVSAAFVRVRLPGGLESAVGALLGLQGLAVHSAAHLGTGLGPQIGRALIAVALVIAAHLGKHEPNT